MRADISTLDKRPEPNQMISNGAIATIGIDWEATMNGARSLSIGRDFARKYPNITATEIPISKPPITSEKVDRVCFVSTPVSNDMMKRSHTLAGEGSKNSGKFVQRVSTYQRTIAKKIVNEVKNTLPNLDFGFQRERFIRLFLLVRAQFIFRSKRKPGGHDLRGSYAYRQQPILKKFARRLESSGLQTRDNENRSL